MSEQSFRVKAPAIMAQLLRDFPITPEDAAAILGNLGHESNGLATLQEIKPTVAGSKGGYGWAQWTGPRRRAYETWCTKHAKDPASDAANYSYLFLELKGVEGSEKGAIGKTVAAKGLDAKVEAFEQAFLRAGVKHYDSRKRWATIALDAWGKATPAASQPIPTPTPPPSSPLPTQTLPEPAKGRGVAGWLILAAVVAAAVVYFIFIKRFPL